MPRLRPRLMRRLRDAAVSFSRAPGQQHRRRDKRQQIESEWFKSEQRTQTRNHYRQQLQTDAKNDSQMQRAVELRRGSDPPRRIGVKQLPYGRVQKDDRAGLQQAETYERRRHKQCAADRPLETAGRKNKSE